MTENPVFEDGGSRPLLFGLGAVFAFAISLAAIKFNFLKIEYYWFHWVILGIVASSLFCVYQFTKNDVRESVLMYFLFAFSAFHFGLVPVYVFSPNEFNEIGFGLEYWYHNIESMEAAYFQAIVFMLGGLASIFIKIDSSAWASEFESDGNLLFLEKISISSFFVMAIGVLSWFLLIGVSGASSYDALLNGLESSGAGALIGVIHTLIGLGIIVSLQFIKNIKFPALLFFGWALVAFPLGLRGEVAFPLLLVIAMLSAQRRINLNFPKLAVMIFLFLSISSVVAVTRINSASESFGAILSTTKGLAELGGSIRPAYEVSEWLASGDKFRFGQTYLAPFERSFFGILPFVERLPAELDDRLMNVLIMRRAGPFGFSIAAEAYFNFGFLGCFIIGIIVGWVMRFSGHRFAKKVFDPILLALVFAIFIHIRQSFVSAYGAFAVCLIIFLAIWIAAKKWSQSAYE